jgi:dATP pyrophosphohydrolase
MGFLASWRLGGASGVKYKIPRSVLVVVHTAGLEVLLLERADHPGFWQSVTGSQDEGETLEQTAVREVNEETGLDAHSYDLRDWQLQNQYEIYQEWRWRYAPGVTQNTEHVFGLMLPRALDVQISPREHLRFLWLPWEEAAGRCFSWSNAQAIRRLGARVSPN